jgi:hypothetical protein
MDKLAGLCRRRLAFPFRLSGFFDDFLFRHKSDDPFLQIGSAASKGIH